MWLFGIFHRQQRELEFAEELESHLAFHMEDNLRAGRAPEEARRRALIKPGGVTLTQELYREQGGLPMLETLFQDLCYGIRMMRKHKELTFVATHASARHWRDHDGVQFDSRHVDSTAAISGRGARVVCDELGCAAIKENDA